MNFKRLLHTKMGIIVISIVLGLGLATVFRKVCTDKNCIIFKGPVISDVVGKTYKHGEKCYKYSIHPTTCNTNKKIIDIKSPGEDNMEFGHQKFL
jgi:hypothetical protein